MTSIRLSYMLLAASLFALSNQALAGYERFDNNMRPAVKSQQAFPELQVIAAPVAASATNVLSATGNSGVAPLVVTAGITNPDVPRNVQVTTGGTTADCAVGNVMVTGSDIFGKALTENLAITNAQAGVTVGLKAFRTVKSISLPLEQGTKACTFAMGVGSKLGLNRCLDAAGYVLFATLNGVYEATRPTVAVSASVVSSNTVTLNSAIPGAQDVAVNYYQNYRCLP